LIGKEGEYWNIQFNGS